MGSQATSTAYTAFTGKTFVIQEPNKRASKTKKEEGHFSLFPLLFFFPWFLNWPFFGRFLGGY